VISEANFNKLVHLLKIKLFFFSIKTHKSIAKSDLGMTSRQFKISVIKLAKIDVNLEKKFADNFTHQ